MATTKKPKNTKAEPDVVPVSKPTMSDAHKAALAQGRTEGRAVRDYLDALRRNKPTRGRQRTAASIERRLSAIDGQLASADAVTELRLVQERRDLVEDLARIDTGVNSAAIEDNFVALAASYSTRHGISYASWREVGVPASVLKRAGVSRST